MKLVLNALTGAWVSQSAFIFCVSIVKLITIAWLFFMISPNSAFLNEVKSSLSENSVLLLMGARDPSLEGFCKDLYEKL